MTSTRELRDEERREGYAACMRALVLARELHDALTAAAAGAGIGWRDWRIDDVTRAVDDTLDLLAANYGFDPAAGNRDEPVIDRLKRARDWHGDRYPDVDGLTPEESYDAGKAAAYADALDLLHGEEITLYSETEAA